MNQNSKVSIVLPTYNGSRYIRQSIESCLNQTYKNIELIIVNDGSTDATKDIVKSYTDARIVYVEHESNRGLAKSLNTGFSWTTGDFLTWTSDDNYYTPDAISVMLSYLLHHPECDFVYTDYYVMNAEGEVVKITSAEPSSILIKRNIVGACFLFRRHVYETIGEYNPATALSEDYDYWLRLSKRFTMHPLRVPLYYYRLHPSSLSAKCVDRMHRRARRLARKRSSYPFCQYILPNIEDTDFVYERVVPFLARIHVAGFRTKFRCFWRELFGGIDK